MTAPGFWDDADKARTAVEELKRVRRWTEPFADLSRRTQDAIELADLIEKEPDPALQKGLADEVEELIAGVQRLELQNMLQGPDDRRSALLTIHPGAGGT